MPAGKTHRSMLVLETRVDDLFALWERIHVLLNTQARDVQLCSHTEWFRKIFSSRLDDSASLQHANLTD